MISKPETNNVRSLIFMPVPKKTPGILREQILQIPENSLHFLLLDLINLVSLYIVLIMLPMLMSLLNHSWGNVEFCVVEVFFSQNGSLVATEKVDPQHIYNVVA